MVLTIFDVEANGLIENHKMPDIYQFGYIRVTDTFKVIGSGSLYYWNSASYLPYDNASGAIHGITEDFLKKHEEDFIKNSATMYALLHNCMVVGKNCLTYDNPVVINHMRKYQPAKCPTFAFGPKIDIQSHAAIYWREYCRLNGIEHTSHSRGTLGDYMKMCGYTEEVIKAFASINGIQLDSEHPHDALYDATMTYMVLCWLFKVKNLRITPTP